MRQIARLTALLVLAVGCSTGSTPGAGGVHTVQVVASTAAAAATESSVVTPTVTDPASTPLATSPPPVASAAATAPTTVEPATTTDPAGGAPFPLAVGRGGKEVAALQQALADSGYDVGPVDGKFGAVTELAVRGFQADSRLEPTGSVDQTQYQRAIDLAAAAPPCDEALLRPASSYAASEWNDPVCVTGWAVRTAFPEGAVGTAYLFRVRGNTWQEVNEIAIDLWATPLLAEGTPLSVTSFSWMFGEPGWPGRASTADEVAKFLFTDIYDEAPSGRFFYELTAMWLDDDGASTWSDHFMVDGDRVAKIEPCKQSTVGRMSGTHWVCEVTLDRGGRLHLEVANDLLKATLWEG